MNSLKEVLGALNEQDHVKEAQAQASEELGADLSEVHPELVKQAQDYDHIGRVLAHHVMADLVKEAVDEEMDGEPEDKKKKEYSAIMAKARGEKSDDKSDDKGDEYKKKMKKDDAESEEDSEKKASIKASILERMSQDPAYVSHLIAKHYQS